MVHVQLSCELMRRLKLCLCICGHIRFRACATRSYRFSSCSSMEPPSVWPNTRNGYAVQSLLGATLCPSIYAGTSRKAVLLDMCARLDCVPLKRHERTVAQLVQRLLQVPGAIFKNWEKAQAHAILRLASKRRRLARAQRSERDLRRRMLLCRSKKGKKNQRVESSALWRMLTCHVCSEARAVNATGFPTCKNGCS